MFNYKHYIPILKWKLAEQKALKALNVENKKYITPLIKFVMPKPSRIGLKNENQDKLFKEIIQLFKNKNSNIANQIIDFWGKSPIFIDFSLLYTTSLKIECFKKTMLQGNEMGAILIPVLNLSEDISIIRIVCSLARKYNTDLCLRLVCSDFINLDTIITFLNSNKLSENSIHLLIDIQENENNEKYNLYMNKCQEIPNLLKWKTFAFAAGAFPVDLSNCKIDEENLRPRIEWNNWVNQISNGILQRVPSFADYTIQYPLYKESYQFYHPTTSIKYTLNNDWLILKGKKQKYNMYLANAKLLAGDERFFGQNFSVGDRYIFDKGKHFDDYQKNPKIKGTGGAKEWLTAGINHHLVCTVNQIANLP